MPAEQTSYHAFEKVVEDAFQKGWKVEEAQSTYSALEASSESYEYLPKLIKEVCKGEDNDNTITTGYEEDLAITLSRVKSILFNLSHGKSTRSKIQHKALALKIEVQKHLLSKDLEETEKAKNKLIGFFNFATAYQISKSEWSNLSTLVKCLENGEVTGRLENQCILVGHIILEHILSKRAIPQYRSQLTYEINKLLTNEELLADFKQEYRIKKLGFKGIQPQAIQNALDKFMLSDLIRQGFGQPRMNTKRRPKPPTKKKTAKRSHSSRKPPKK